ncbi:MAG TPA: Sulphatase-modifying factor protein [Cyanobacteria bacterium UBA11372]|nr:Sulphatase-modifying factor protein [Cyanobacteria bacterium UBA11372]
MNALYDALKYGEKGLDLLLQALQDESIEVKNSAYFLLNTSPVLELRINALYDAIKYGDQGLDLVLPALQDKSIEVQFAAYSLLKDRQEPKVKQQLDNGLPFFEFEVVTVDVFGKINSRRRHYARYFTEDLGNGVGLEMVAIPGGTFQMGEPDKYNWEKPVHQVTIKPFFMSKYPITQEQWQAVMGDNPSDLKSVKLPVHNVSWRDAKEFCAKLSQKTRKNYGLPSEAEWEYACRAGTTTPFYFGEAITPDLVNYYGYKPYVSPPKGLFRHATQVGSFPPNSFGLYDMHGNFWEWCQDVWHDNYNGAPCNGSSWETGGVDDRVQRGGSWIGGYPSVGAIACRSANRSRKSLGDRDGNHGFRVAVTLPYLWQSFVTKVGTAYHFS